MYKVSVILTTFNAESTIQRALDSLFAQAGLNQLFSLELLIIDDCSTDRTLGILSSNKIPYWSTPQNSGGPNQGRNIGLRMATGDYICIMDHDDEWHPSKIEIQLKAAEYAPIVSCGYMEKSQYSGTRIIASKTDHEDGFIEYPENSAFLTIMTRDKRGQKLYIGSLFFHHSLKSILFEEHFGKIDFDWLLKLTHQQKTIEVADPLYTRHVEGQNLSLNLTYRIQDFYYNLLSLESYKAQYPKECKTAYLKLHGSRARYHYLMGEMTEARFFFLRAEFSLKTLFYYLTTFGGHKWVKKRFKVF